MQDADAIICRHCEQEGSLVYEIAFTSVDGLYQFVCDSVDHGIDDGLPIHSNHVFSENDDFEFLRHLKRNFLARRLSDGEGWEVRFIDIDELPDD